MPRFQPSSRADFGRHAERGGGVGGNGGEEEGVASSMVPTSTSSSSSANPRDDPSAKSGHAVARAARAESPCRDDDAGDGGGRQGEALAADKAETSSAARTGTDEDGETHAEAEDAGGRRAGSPPPPPQYRHDADQDAPPPARATGGGATAAAAAAIGAIPRDDVHRITSGQVVLDLQTAVKELVENSLDAGATSVEVRFKEYGAEGFEVLDNGSGIDPANYDGVALKHHTSKLRDFGDLTSVSTFGFRGEALSSLCALANVAVTTATRREAPAATVLEFGRDGAVVSRARKCARQHGCTVSVTDLFLPLPVRRRDFERNVRRELAKAQGVLQAYALVARGVRWSVTNAVKGKRNTLLNVSPANSDSYLVDNVSAVFSARVASTLMPMELVVRQPEPAATAAAAAAARRRLDATRRRRERQEERQPRRLSGRARRSSTQSGRALKRLRLDSSDAEVEGARARAGEEDGSVAGGGCSDQDDDGVEDGDRPSDTDDEGEDEDEDEDIDEDGHGYAHEDGDGEEKQDAEAGTVVRVRGLISKPTSGHGRASSDRSYLYLNGRPWDNARLTRCFNDVYRSFNAGQYPMVVADVEVQGERYDVNLSPDKRTMLLHEENAVVEGLRAELEKLFAPFRSTYKLEAARSVGTWLSAGATCVRPESTRPAAARSRSALASAPPSQNQAAAEAEAEPAMAEREPVDVDSKRADADEGGEAATEEDQEEDEEEASVRRGLLDEARTARGESRVRNNGTEGTSQAEDRDTEATRDDVGGGDGEAEDTEARGGRDAMDRRTSTPPPETTADSVVMDTTQASWSPHRRGRPGASSSTVEGARQSEAPLTSQLPGRRGPHADGARMRAQLAGHLRSWAMPGSQVGMLSADRLKSQRGDEEGEGQGDEEGEGEMQEREQEDSEAEMDPASPQDAAPTTSQTSCQCEDEEAGQADMFLEKGRDAAPSAPTEAGQEEDSEERQRHLSELDQAALAAERTHVDAADPIQKRHAPRAEEDDAEILDVTEHGEVVVGFDMVRLRARMEKRRRRRELERGAQDTSVGRASTAAVASDVAMLAGVAATDAAEVERQLSRVIDKSDFAEMSVVGQFNLGFIIARRRRRAPARGGDEAGSPRGRGDADEMDDLFIIDQHASDEKYNFETLQTTTRIRSQPLISPRTLELSASDELVASEHLETIRANGFELRVDESAPLGSRVRLLAQPVSDQVVFGVRDLEELLHLLRDKAPESALARSTRCSRARAMFASRACRKSVMIGMPLKPRQMRRILANLSSIEQPWNCPHGRPTMRHLVDLRSLTRPTAPTRDG